MIRITFAAAAVWAFLFQASAAESDLFVNRAFRDTALHITTSQAEALYSTYLGETNTLFGASAFSPAVSASVEGATAPKKSPPPPPAAQPPNPEPTTGITSPAPAAGIAPARPAPR